MKETKIENIHPTLIEAMKLHAHCWKLGEEEAVIITASGSIYRVTSDGTLFGGCHLTEERPAQLSGAVYRKGGPIRAKHITVGLCIEVITVDKKILVTSPVCTIKAISELAEAG